MISGQLTFEDIRVNPSVKPEDENRLSGHVWQMLKRLEQGPATNKELIDLTGTFNFTARASEMRKLLETRGKGLIITEKAVGGQSGVNMYEIKE